MSDSRELVSVLEQAAFAAAQHMILSLASGRALHATHKADQSVLTVLDLESQEIIRAKLRGTIAIVAEEDVSSHEGISLDEFILVDPLDGTSACRRFPGVQGGQVGYGPLLGYCSGGSLAACVYVNVPTQKMFTAVRGRGAYVVELAHLFSRPEYSSRQRLVLTDVRRIEDSAIIFYPGRNGEMQAVDRLRRAYSFETAYRFGGFANDCTRLAQGFEQVEIQFSAKPWDLSAALVPAEAGLSVIVDPMGKAVPLSEYRIEPLCPVLICAPAYANEFTRTVRGDGAAGLRW